MVYLRFTKPDCAAILRQAFSIAIPVDVASQHPFFGGSQEPNVDPAGGCPGSSARWRTPHSSLGGRTLVDLPPVMTPVSEMVILMMM